jgi:hypothetical protein
MYYFLLFVGFGIMLHSYWWWTLIFCGIEIPTGKKWNTDPLVFQHLHSIDSLFSNQGVAHITVFLDLVCEEKSDFWILWSFFFKDILLLECKHAKSGNKTILTMIPPSTISKYHWSHCSREGHTKEIIACFWV